MYLEALTVRPAVGAGATGLLIGLHDEHCGSAARPSSAVLPAGSLRPAKPASVVNIVRIGSANLKAVCKPEYCQLPSGRRHAHVG